MRGQGLGLLVAAMLTGACSDSANISGHVSLTSLSGEVKREPNVEVLLVRVTDAFEAEWNQAVAAFTSGSARAMAAAEEAEAARARASADRSSASFAWLSVLLQKDGFNWKAYDEATKRHQGAVERLLRAGHHGREARSRLGEIAKRYRKEAWDLIQTHQTQIVRTDANGRFEFKSTAPGRCVLASRFPDSEPDVYWFVPLDIRPRGGHIAELTTKNAGWPFS